MVTTRRAGDADWDAIAAEIAKDPWHKDVEGFDPAIFVGPHTRTMVFGDDQGPIAYVNIRNVALATIQFADVGKDRLRKGIEEAFPQFAEGLKKAGALGIIYESKNPVLIWFLRKFGFRQKDFQMKEL
jgi:hypothetical protein